jgi:hypothetical protein
MMNNVNQRVIFSSINFSLYLILIIITIEIKCKRQEFTYKWFLKFNIELIIVINNKEYKKDS